MITRRLYLLRRAGTRNKFAAVVNNRPLAAEPLCSDTLILHSREEAVAASSTLPGGHEAYEVVPAILQIDD